MTVLNDEQVLDKDREYLPKTVDLSLSLKEPVRPSAAKVRRVAFADEI